MATSAVTLLPAKNNGESSMTPAIVAVGCTLDGIGGARQVGFITSASANILSSVGLAAIAASAATVGTLCSGVVSMGFSATATIPDAYQSMKKAETELATLEAQNTVTLQSTAPKVNPRLESARHMLTIRKLGLVSQSALFVMGAAQAACGVVSMLGSEVASVFHYSTVLSGTVAAVATIATSVALGAIYIFRGSVMIYRSFKAYSLTSEFHKEFRNQLSLEAKIAFMAEREAFGESYMNPRVDSSCLTKTLKDGRTCTMTAKGYKFTDGSNTFIEPYTSPKEKAEYLQRVDKGIFTEKLKHIVSGIVGCTMIIGGVLTLALTALSHGTAPIIISLASAIFFMLTESIFLTYDASAIFDRVRDYLYGPVTETGLATTRPTSNVPVTETGLATTRPRSNAFAVIPKPPAAR